MSPLHIRRWGIRKAAHIIPDTTEDRAEIARFIADQPALAKYAGNIIPAPGEDPEVVYPVIVTRGDVLELEWCNAVAVFQRVCDAYVLVWSAATCYDHFPTPTAQVMVWA